MALKVLYILPPTKTFAGIERVVDDICSQMMSGFGNRVDVHVLFMARYPDHDIEDRFYIKIQRNVSGKLSLIRTFRDVVGSVNYDIVVVPQVEATVIAWLSCVGLKRRFILYLHGNPKLEMRSWKARVLFRALEWLVLPRLSGVFGTSKNQLAAFRKMYPSKIPHFWVPNPVRRFAALPSDTATIDRPVTYINVGRFSYQKGQDVFLKAFAKAYRSRQNIRLLLVGYGADEGSLTALITSLGIGSVARIEYHPHNPQKPLTESDVYVSTSRWEGWSLAICEALRVGLPVIATDCDFGPSDILVDRRLGLLVPLDDEEKIAEAIVTFHDNLQQEKAHRAYRMEYIERFSVETVVHDHVAALEEVCRTPPRLQSRSPQHSVRAS